MLEELIDSFKNMQTRYDGEMQDLQKTFEDYSNNYEFALRKLEEEYRQKLNTLEPVLHQLHRKDENLAFIEEKLAQLERRPERLNGSQSTAPEASAATNANTAKLVEELKRSKAENEDKSRAIRQYQAVIDKLKQKFN